MAVVTDEAALSPEPQKPASLALLAIVVVHVALTFRFEPWSVVFGPEPIAGIDYDTHYEQTVRAVEAFKTSGRMWAWDPHLLAGQISGAIFDADTKLHELFVVLLGRLGVAPHRAFNLFVVLAHLALPAVTYVSARLFRLRHAQAVCAVGLASACWFFDAFSHWVFWVGMVSYGFAAYAAMLPLALFFRYLDDKKPSQIVLVALLLAAQHHLHPYSFFILAGPMTFLFVRAWKDLGTSERAAIFGTAAFVVAANVWWLRPALRFFRYVLDSAFYLDAGASYLVFDYLGLLKEPSTTGVLAVRSGFRFLAYGGALLALVAWRKAKDARFPLFAMALGMLLGAAYFGGYFPPLRQVQPYRFALAATFLACIPAGAFLVDAVGELRELAAKKALPRVAALLLGLAAFVGVPRLARDVIYFLPELVPKNDVPLPGILPNVNGALGFGTVNWPDAFDYKHTRMTDDVRALVDWVKTHDDGQSRFLVESWILGERLAWATDAQVLGGFRELNLQHSDANWFRKHPTGGSPDPKELPAYLRRYNVGWVVMTAPLPEIESRTDVLSPFARVAAHRIFKVKQAPSFLESDAPAKVTAKLDLLRVEGAPPGDLVLRYHFLETLKCRPGCEVHRVEIPGDRVGFLGVKGAPADFEIYNPR